MGARALASCSFSHLYLAAGGGGGSGRRRETARAASRAAALGSVREGPREEESVQPPGRRRRGGWGAQPCATFKLGARRRAGAYGALEAMRPLAHPVPGAAGQPPGDLGHGAGVRPGPDPPRWSLALPAAQQSARALHQPQGDQPETSDVPGKVRRAGAFLAGLPVAVTVPSAASSLRPPPALLIAWLRSLFQ